MIFYFTATGNSLYVANQISKTTQDDKKIKMTRDEIEKHICYDLSQEEYLGFVMPVYWYGCPSIVEEFLKQVQFTGYKNQYVYVFLTYGGSVGTTLDYPIRKLLEKGIKVDGQFGVKMIDNYILAYDVSSKEQQEKILEDANNEITKILAKMVDKQPAIQVNKGLMKLIGKPVHRIYEKLNLSKKFWVEDSCIHCEKCSKLCPTNAITMVDGKPQWNTGCTGCLGCIHQCPVQAIQYGKNTKKRHRYYNPLV